MCGPGPRPLRLRLHRVGMACMESCCSGGACSRWRGCEGAEMNVQSCPTFHSPHDCPEQHYSFCRECRRDNGVGLDGVCNLCGYRHFKHCPDCGNDKVRVRLKEWCSNSWHQIRRGAAAKEGNKGGLYSSRKGTRTQLSWYQSAPKIGRILSSTGTISRCRFPAKNGAKCR